jgi:hypothetical protein
MKFLTSAILVLGAASTVAGCGGGGSSSGSALAASPVAAASAPAPAVQATVSANIADFMTKDVTAQLAEIGVWDGLGELADTGLIDAWGVVHLGDKQREGIMLSGWAYTGFNNTASTTTPVSVALLAQNDDGTQRLATDLLPSPATHGNYNVIAADFNGDGFDDIVLPAHNESPFVAEPSVAFLSQPGGGFKRTAIADSVMAHHAKLATLNGKPTILAAAYYPGMTNPLYTYDGAGGMTVGATGPRVSGMSVTTGDFLGIGSPQIVYGDVNFAPGVPFDNTKPMEQYLYRFDGTSIDSSPIRLPAPYFNDKPQYAALKSGYGASKTHNSRLWTDDINQDGKPDVVVGAEVWEASVGLQKTQLQLLVNQGGGAFVDQTNAWASPWNEDANYDYHLRMADVDGSGIKTYFLAERAQCTIGADGKCAPDNTRHGNYILVNDGTGQFHVAMHDEFVNIGNQVNAYVAAHYPGPSYFIDAKGVTPRIIPFQAASGVINFVAAVQVQKKLADNRFALKTVLVNVPLAIHLNTDFKKNITITDRHGSRNIRTFAGDDTIAGGNQGGTAAVDGGAGSNTVVYAGKRANYSVAKTATGFTVTDTAGNDGTDRLKNIQTLKFADETVNLTTL